MNKIDFEKSVVVRGKSIDFEKQQLHDRYSIWVPSEFVKDAAMLSSYTYWYSREDSPLSIAIRHTKVSSDVDRKKMIAHYFSRGGDAQPVQSVNGVSYRDTLAKGLQMSVYSLRFAIEVENAVLFGCFNCAGDDMEAWKPVVVAMLEAVVAD